MLTAYIDEAMARAKYKILEDGTYFGEIPDLQGVWANASTLEDCRRELQEVLEGWLILKIRDNDPIPALGRMRIHLKSAYSNVREAFAASRSVDVSRRERRGRPDGHQKIRYPLVTLSEAKGLGRRRDASLRSA